jgi:hypothetical protein
MWNISGILCGMITKDVRCTREVKARIGRAKAAFKKNGCFHQEIGLYFKAESSEILSLEHSVVWC